MTDSTPNPAITLLAKKLKEATGPDAELDKAMAKMLGWKLTEESYADSEGQAKQRVFWLVPSGNDTGTPPKCTTHVNDAYKLMLLLAPHLPAACVCHADGTAQVRVEDGDTYSGANPAIAICLAALGALLKKQL